MSIIVKGTMLVLFGLAALLVGIACVALGTRFRATVAGSVLIIVGGAITAIGVMFVGLEGLEPVR